MRSAKSPGRARRQASSVQRRNASSGENASAIAPPAVDFVDGGTNKTGLPDRLKAGIESLSGIDMSDVRVHANSARPAQVGALAYAQGNEIHLGSGQEKHLAHEAWHVVTPPRNS
jgi:hypothetical protein